MLLYIYTHTDTHTQLSYEHYYASTYYSYVSTENPIFMCYIYHVYIRWYISVRPSLIASILYKIVFSVWNHFFKWTYFHLFFAFLELYEKYVNKVMSIIILITFHVLRFDIYVPTYEHWNSCCLHHIIKIDLIMYICELCLVNILTFSTCVTVIL